MSTPNSQESVPRTGEHTRTGLSKAALKQDFLDNLFYIQGRFREVASPHDLYMAAAFTTRDRLLKHWVESAQVFKTSHARTVCYLSAEYLLGPHLATNLVNLGIMETAHEASKELGLDLEAILEEEEEPGLGNGGLGRLAACFMESLSTCQIPAIGYGIRYEFGIFDQAIEDGWQVEKTDNWLRNGNPWEIPRPRIRFAVGYGGYTESYRDERGQTRRRWQPALVINGMAYDTPILGYRTANANLLRLWKAEATCSFDFQAFNTGDYYGAVHASIQAETISKVLYPNDEPEAGKELRLKQQYFFVSCSVQDMIRLHLNTVGPLETFAEKFVIQLNDTHPALAVVELMRLLLDEHAMSWEQAWDITHRTFCYTNHTLLPEALETWSVSLFERLLPRHLELIYEINRRFLDEVRMRFLGDEARVWRMSLIAEGSERRVRMANLAVVGSRAVNGVAKLHSKLVKTMLFKDFADLWPDRFHNVTNGVTPRRFMVVANPRLSKLITRTCGHDHWIRDLELLRELEAHVDDAGFQAEWRAVKYAAKRDLVEWMQQTTDIRLDPESLFDVQAKRFHEYKRQHLKVLHVIRCYQQIKQGQTQDLVPRAFIFGGKAAPGYFMAKLMIKLINAVGAVINNDPQVNGWIRVAFLPNFNVKNSQRLYPAADLSEQISLAGKEASGTGNMKFSMNGALTIGTLDGANVEIREAVGAENFFLFGMTAEEALQRQITGYRPWEFYQNDPELKSDIDLINSGLFSHGDTQLFRPLTDNLINHDPFMVLADYRAYLDCQKTVSDTYKDRERWTRMSIFNVARIGRFSSDRAIREYAEHIWKVEPRVIDPVTEVDS
ncbi:glycogen/starch/alpha-glucan phosphorylase [Thermochromatium tepidum]|uniref:Alpha-1,4 glucan phosphorylase n=1 Tax=Thermochromatium tepidum ATCC 43061 TaxID=316276 RepID=A0A6I6ED36_THETI|nr:glycogen/starch/alpha-glucan phosphorylase [Thermochromatium tepidum]QGU32859.1 glycogen/starch/alpha-glucan family phosphorylase [Thermochromatium tepidum ATCC 43061]